MGMLSPAAPEQPLPPTTPSAVSHRSPCPMSRRRVRCCSRPRHPHSHAPPMLVLPRSPCTLASRLLHVPFVTSACVLHRHFSSRHLSATPPVSGRPGRECPATTHLRRPPPPASAPRLAVAAQAPPLLRLRRCCSLDRSPPSHPSSLQPPSPPLPPQVPLLQPSRTYVAPARPTDHPPQLRAVSHARCAFCFSQEATGSLDDSDPCRARKVS